MKVLSFVMKNWQTRCLSGVQAPSEQTWEPQLKLDVEVHLQFIIAVSDWPRLSDSPSPLTMKTHTRSHKYTQCNFDESRRLIDHLVC